MSVVLISVSDNLNSCFVVGRVIEESMFNLPWRYPMNQCGIP